MISNLLAFLQRFFADLEKIFSPFGQNPAADTGLQCQESIAQKVLKFNFSAKKASEAGVRF